MARSSIAVRGGAPSGARMGAVGAFRTSSITSPVGPVACWTHRRNAQSVPGDLQFGVRTEFAYLAADRGRFGRVPSVEAQRPARSDRECCPRPVALTWRGPPARLVAPDPPCESPLSAPPGSAPPFPPAAAHVSDFGRNDSFNMCLVEIDTDAGITGLGEAKAAVGNLGNYAAIVTLIQRRIRPAPGGPRPARHHRRLGPPLQRLARALRDPRGPDLPHHRPPRHHALRRVRRGHRALGHPRPLARRCRVWRLHGRPLPRPRARLCLRRLGAGGEHRQADAPVRGARPPRGEDAGGAPGRERGRFRRPRGGGARDARAPASASWWTPTAPGACARPNASRGRSRRTTCAWLEEPVSPDNLAGQAEVRRVHRHPHRGRARASRRASPSARCWRPARWTCSSPIPPSPAASPRCGRIAALAASHSAHGGAASLGLRHPLRHRAASLRLHALRDHPRVLPRP